MPESPSWLKANRSNASPDEHKLRSMIKAADTTRHKVLANSRNGDYYFLLSPVFCLALSDPVGWLVGWLAGWLVGWLVGSRHFGFRNRFPDGALVTPLPGPPKEQHTKPTLFWTSGPTSGE